MDVRILAARLGVSGDFVYSHARELGGVKLSDSPKAPWRFDIGRARDAMVQRTEPLATPEPLPRRRRKPDAAANGVALLPIRGQE